MSANTKIEWADHTFNPWIGCTKVGPGCDNCYAKAEFDDRRHRATWGAGQPRSRTKTWSDPVRWNKQHEAFYAAHGRRQRVFCASLADVFDNEVPTEWRIDLLNLIIKTPHLDWLLLTKRIGNAMAMLDEALIAATKGLFSWQSGGGYKRFGNVWIGATIVNQAEADRDVPKLLAVPAAKRFLSMEPLLGPVTVFDLDSPIDVPDGMKSPLDWVIVGGESGPNARPMHPDWARSLRDQCVAVGVPFLFKQWGEWIDDDNIDSANLPTPQISDPGEHFHECDHGTTSSWRVGKKAAGRMLDGRTWDEVPT